MTDTDTVRILLVESRSKYARLVQAMLKASYTHFTVEWVTMLDEAITHLKENEYDAVITDIMLGDGGGHEVVQQLITQCTTVPIILIMENPSIGIGKEMLSHGAQDYLSITELSVSELEKSISFSTEREKLTANLKGMSMTDDLTQLFNRRGFRNLAEQQIRITDRTNRPSSFLFIDLDNLKMINDTSGHATGDRAIKEMAEILNEVLRNTDIIGRLGGDEFVVMAPDTNDYHAHLVINRLRDKIDQRNGRGDRAYNLSASIGVITYHSGNNQSLTEIQEAACEKMYEEKKQKKELDEDLTDTIIVETKLP